MEKKYQIRQEGQDLCLYTGTVSHSWFDKSSSFDVDPLSKTTLKNFTLNDNFQNFKNRIKGFNEIPIPDTFRRPDFTNDPVIFWLWHELPKLPTDKYG